MQVLLSIVKWATAFQDALDNEGVLLIRKPVRYGDKNFTGDSNQYFHFIFLFRGYLYVAEFVEEIVVSFFTFNLRGMCLRHGENGR